MSAASLFLQLFLGAPLAWLTWHLWRDDDQLPHPEPQGKLAAGAVAAAPVRSGRRFLAMLLREASSPGPFGVEGPPIIPVPPLRPRSRWSVLVFALHHPGRPLAPEGGMNFIQVGEVAVSFLVAATDAEHTAL